MKRLLKYIFGWFLTIVALAFLLRPLFQNVVSPIPIVKQATGSKSEDVPQSTTGHPEADSFYNHGMGDILSKNNPDAAIKDFTQSIQLNPGDAKSYYMRGYAELAKNDFESAIQDYSTSLQLKPNDPDAYEGRAIANHAAGHLKEAIADYRKQAEIRPWNSSLPHLRIWLAESASGADLESATAELKAFVSHPPDLSDGVNDFKLKIASFVVGKTSQNELLEAAAHPKYPEDLHTFQCEAAFYIGMKALLSGSETSARESFEESVSEPYLAWQRGLEFKLAQKWLADHPPLK